MVTPEVEENMLRFLTAALKALPPDLREKWEAFARENGRDLPYSVRIEGDECIARVGGVIIGRTPAEPILNWRPGRN